MKLFSLLTDVSRDWILHFPRNGSTNIRKIKNERIHVFGILSVIPTRWNVEYKKNGRKIVTNVILIRPFCKTESKRIGIQYSNVQLVQFTLKLGYILNTYQLKGVVYI